MPGGVADVEVSLCRHEDEVGPQETLRDTINTVVGRELRQKLAALKRLPGGERLADLARRLR